jgi:hypothetical protein
VTGASHLTRPRCCGGHVLGSATIREKVCSATAAAFAPSRIFEMATSCCRLTCPSPRLFCLQGRGAAGTLVARRTAA